MVILPEKSTRYFGAILILHLLKALEDMIKNVKRLGAMPSSNNRLEGDKYCTLCLNPGEIKVVPVNGF